MLDSRLAGFADRLECPAPGLWPFAGDHRRALAGLAHRASGWRVWTFDLRQIFGAGFFGRVDVRAGAMWVAGQGLAGLIAALDFSMLGRDFLPFDLRRIFGPRFFGRGGVRAALTRARRSFFATEPEGGYPAPGFPF